MRIVNISVAKEFNKCFDSIQKMPGSTSRNICTAVSKFITNKKPPIILDKKEWDFTSISKTELERMDRLIRPLNKEIIRELEKR